VAGAILDVAEQRQVGAEQPEDRVSDVDVDPSPPPPTL
jgi:hypothetical protein